MVGQWFPNAKEALIGLNERLVKQKDQEPRRKLVEDLQLIHNRKKNDVCIPILRGHDQESWFDKLDSNEIWEQVFEFVPNPSDITSAYFACEMFRKHLEEKRKMMLLPKVFGVLRDAGYLKYWGFAEEIRNAKKAKSRDVLNLRLVSKTWKKFAEEELLVPVKFSQSPPIWHSDAWKSPMVCRLRSVGEVDAAMERLVNPSSSAALIRLLEIDDDDDRHTDKGIFYNKLAEFLDIHGESVWALLFYKNDMPDPRDLSDQDLCLILSKMPQLKALWLRDCTSDEIEAKEVFPFPILPTLEHLHVCSNTRSKSNGLLVAEILRKSLNLKALSMQRIWDDQEDEVLFTPNSPIPDEVWDALGNLRLEYFDLTREALEGADIIPDFLRLQQFDWPLRFLRVCKEKDVDVFQIEASRILAVLSRFNESLEEFGLNCAGGYFITGYDKGSVVIDFPKLQKLKLSDLLL